VKLSEQLRFRLYPPRGFQSLLHRRALRNRQPPEFTSAIWATAGEILDDQAKPAYKARLTALREELEEAKEVGNVERAAKAEEEIEALNANSLAESTAVAAAAGRVRPRNERARARARRKASRLRSTGSQGMTLSWEGCSRNGSGRGSIVPIVLIQTFQLSGSLR
jgi:hypothetical protein